jgi:hypothetical protein
VSLAGYAFYVIALTGLGYFTLVRRTFDFTALAFFASCFYFLPGFLGFVGYPEGLLLRPVPVLTETYAVMCLVLVGLLASGVLSDLLPVSPVAPTDPADAFPHLAARIATLLGLCGAVLTWATTWEALTTHSKFALLEELNRWYLLWTTCATLGAVLAYRSSAWILLAINMAMLLLDLYVGFRVELVVSALTIATLFLIDVGPARLARRWRLAVLVLGLGLLMFSYKAVSVAIKVGDWELIASQLNNTTAWQQVFFYSEPFVTQGILNEIIRQDFGVGMGHFGNIALLVVPYANELGGEPLGFTDLFQPVVFSSVTDYGVGSNIWAEMWSSGGWYLLVLAVFAYCVFMVTASRLLASLSKEASSILAVVLVYWAFYVHRNDLGYQLTLTRRLLLTGAAIVALSIFFGLTAREWRRRGQHAVAEPPPLQHTG